MPLQVIDPLVKHDSGCHPADAHPVVDDAAITATHPVVPSHVEGARVKKRGHDEYLGVRAADSCTLWLFDMFVHFGCMSPFCEHSAVRPFRPVCVGSVDLAVCCDDWYLTALDIARNMFWVHGAVQCEEEVDRRVDEGFMNGVVDVDVELMAKRAVQIARSAQVAGK